MKQIIFRVKYCKGTSNMNAKKSTKVIYLLVIFELKIKLVTIYLTTS